MHVSDPIRTFSWVRMCCCLSFFFCFRGSPGVVACAPFILHGEVEVGELANTSLSTSTTGTGLAVTMAARPSAATKIKRSNRTMDGVSVGRTFTEKLEAYKGRRWETLVDYLQDLELMV
ncbi:hypothetical protein BHE74_00032186 [Ensete ventricosum]|nr:hypothetical protein BHE74_00032186 [Ensete ventricosum]RZS01203.1 hypothetical protein BHM03_00031011 [Ensete ventricosum]